MIADFKFGLRQIFRRPLLAVTISLLLAVGLGANIVIFGLIDALLLKPLPVRNPANLWIVQQTHKGQSNPVISFTYGQFLALSKTTALFSALTAEQDFGQASVYPLEDSSVVITQMVAPNYFSELGVAAQLGRTLTADDAEATGDIPAMISYQFWQSRYAGSPSVIGRIIHIRNRPFRIAGVLPRGFHSLDVERSPDVILPISASQSLVGVPVDDVRTDEFRDGFRILLRLAPGVTAAAIEPAAGKIMRHQAQTEFLARNASLANPMTPEDARRFLDGLDEGSFTAEPAGKGLSRLRTQFSLALQLLMAGVSLLLVAICTNIAGLLLTRGEERRKELAIRLSLGAGRGRLLRQLMIENLCLSLPGALLAIAFAAAGTPLLLRVLPPVRSFDQLATSQVLAVTPDIRVLLFSWAAVLLSVCFFGLFPAWRSARLSPSLELKGGSASASNALTAMIPVCLEAALGVLLLAAGALMLRTYFNLQTLRPGFDQAHIAGFTLGINDARFSAAQRRAYLAELQRRISSQPGVRSTAFAMDGLMRGSGHTLPLIAENLNQRNAFITASYNDVSLDYFATMGIPLLEGREFVPADLTARPYPVVIDRQLANLLFPHINPIGRGLVVGKVPRSSPDYIVEGVVETAKYRSMKEAPPPTMYTVSDEESYRLVLYVRTTGNPAAIINPVRRLIREMGAVPLFETTTLEQEARDSLWQERLVAVLAAFFSVVALLLAAIGLYGTLAYSVERRRRELGIRLALGANARQISQTVCSRTAIAMLLGVAAGIALAAAALRLTRSFLYGVEPWDAFSFTWAVATVLICGVIAATIPTLKALRTDAATALREQ